jgi:hypothetical protein
MYVCVTFLKSFTALSASGLRTPLEYIGEYSATARRVRDYDLYVQTSGNFFHTLYTAYRQLKCCIQSLLDGLCKRAKFQMQVSK